MMILVKLTAARKIFVSQLADFTPSEQGNFGNSANTFRIIAPKFTRLMLAVLMMCGVKENSPHPGHTQTEQSEEKTNPRSNKYMKVWFN